MFSGARNMHVGDPRANWRQTIWKMWTFSQCNVTRESKCLFQICNLICAMVQVVGRRAIVFGGCADQDSNPVILNDAYACDLSGTPKLPELIRMLKILNSASLPSNCDCFLQGRRIAGPSSRLMGRYLLHDGGIRRLLSVRLKSLYSGASGRKID